MHNTSILFSSHFPVSNQQRNATQRSVNSGLSYSLSDIEQANVIVNDAHHEYRLRAFRGEGNRANLLLLLLLLQLRLNAN